MCGWPFAAADPQPVPIAVPLPAPLHYGGKPVYFTCLVVRRSPPSHRSRTRSAGGWPGPSGIPTPGSRRCAIICSVTEPPIGPIRSGSGSGRWSRRRPQSKACSRTEPTSRRSTASYGTCWSGMRPRGSPASTSSAGPPPPLPAPRGEPRDRARRSPAAERSLRRDGGRAFDAPRARPAAAQRLRRRRRDGLRHHPATGGRHQLSLPGSQVATSGTTIRSTRTASSIRMKGMADITTWPRVTLNGATPFIT